MTTTHPPPPPGGSWITKPGWQVFAGVMVVVFILAAYFSSLQQIQAERDQRQDDFEHETSVRAKNIEEAQVRIACAFITGVEKAFKPVSLDGVTDEVTRNRLIITNQQRAEAIATIRGQMPPEIIDRINLTCPPQSG